MITGASGLLGSAVREALRPDADLLPVCHRPGRGDMRAIDLVDPAQLESLAREPWDALVHCAAYRSPDFCEQNPAAARRLNAEVPVELARLARARGARMIHVSTDYVFPGTQPPYDEDAPREAVNVYGQTKIEAEEGIEAACPSAVILRIGALYAVPTLETPSPMLQEALDAVSAREPQYLDDRIVRCPSLADDVAQVIRFLLTIEAGGIVHASARSCCTRYAWTGLVAQALGLAAAQLRPTDRDLGRPARRPVNSQLRCDRLVRLGGPLPRDAGLVLPELAPRLRRLCPPACGTGAGGRKSLCSGWRDDYRGAAHFPDAEGYAMSRQSLNWEDMYQALGAFRKEHGDCNVSANWSGNPQLGRWVAMQRYRRKIGELPARYVERLDKLGFVWSPTEAVWNEMFARLQAYRTRHGNCDVPSQYPEDPHLANWVANQRHRRKTGSLSTDRIKRLEQAGFVWAVYGKGTARRPVEKKPDKAPPRKSEPACEERLYMAGAGRYVQFNGTGPLPSVLGRYVSQHGGEFPPYIPLPPGPVSFHLGDDLLGRKRKVAWSGKGPIPETVLEFVDENGILPPHS